MNYTVKTVHIVQPDGSTTPHTGAIGDLQKGQCIEVECVDGFILQMNPHTGHTTEIHQQFTVLDHPDGGITFRPVPISLIH